MSIQFTNPVIGLDRTTGLVQGNINSYSWIIWFRPDVDLVNPNYQTVIAQETATQDQGVYSVAAIPTNYNLDVNDGGGSIITANTIFLAGHWYPIWYTRNATTHKFYASGKLIGTLVKSVAAITWTDLFLGYDGGGQNKGTFAYFREWTENVSIANLQLESNSRTAVHTTNLVTDTPLTNNLLDLTSNHHDWPDPGSGYSFLTDDPIPANTVASDPKIITTPLPYVSTVDIKVTNVEFLFNKWFKYTTPANKIYIAGEFLGDLTNLSLVTDVYSDAGITPYPTVNSALHSVNKPITIPVIAGNSYWFRVVPTWTDFSTHTINISFLDSPNLPIPKQSILVNDDADGYGASILSGTQDYTVLQYLNPFPNGEGGDVLIASNRWLFSNEGQNQLLRDLQLWDGANVIFIKNVTINYEDGHVAIRANNTLNVWHVGWFGDAFNAKVAVVNPDGTVGTIYDLGGLGLFAVAAKNDGSYIYTCGVGLLAQQNAIRRFNTATLVYDSDLVAQIASYSITDILVLSDDKIVATYVKNDKSDSFIKIYNSNGTLFNTIDTGIVVRQDYRLTLGYNDPTYFWIYYHNPLGISNFKEVNVATGTFRTVRNDVEYEVGVYVPAATLTPLSRYGHSASCPFIIINTSDSSGLYYVTPPSTVPSVPSKATDTLLTNANPISTIDVKLPNPIFRTALLGD